jgi:hypothetical protein
MAQSGSGHTTVAARRAPVVACRMIAILRGGGRACVLASGLLVFACGGDDDSADDTADDTGDDADDDADDSGDGFPTSADGITAEAAGTRADPEGVAPDAEVTDLTWRDSRGAARTMVLGGYLYQIDFAFAGGEPDISVETARSANDDAYGHEGFGYVVSHNDQNGNSPLGKGNAPAAVETTVFSGGHHAIHRIELVYDRDREEGGQGIAIPVVIEWMVATGRDHPVWAVTWRTGAAENPGGVDFDAFRMDVRGPYGSLNFDGAADRGMGDAIGGVAWGDAEFAFESGGDQLTLASPWTYDAPNQVAFTRAWTASTNAEMGVVQTRVGDVEMGYPDRVNGRERGATSDADYLDKADCNGLGDPRVYAMPCVSGWPYQLMNYDWDPGTGKPPEEATGTKLIAWGTPYGWLGASSFSTFTGEADGSGDRAYAAFIVLGPKCRYGGEGGACDQPGDVERTIAAVEALAAATVEPTTGQLAAEAPRGPGATDTKPLVGGYDDTMAAHVLVADQGGVAFTFAPAAGQPVDHPIIAIDDYDAADLPAIRIDGAELSVNTGDSDAGAFASLDTATGRLWLTLNRTIEVPTAIEIGPASQ